MFILELLCFGVHIRGQRLHNAYCATPDIKNQKVCNRYAHLVAALLLCVLSGVEESKQPKMGGYSLPARSQQGIVGTHNKTGYVLRSGSVAFKEKLI